MKGAIAELFASTSSTPNRTSVITIGASQYFLFSFMNCQSSLNTCAFDIFGSSKHFFVMARVTLSLRVWPPIRFALRCASIKWVPSKQTLDETDRRHDRKEDKRQDDSRHDERKHFRQSHPRFVRPIERARQDESQQHERAPERQCDLRGMRKLAAVHPPRAHQKQNAADDETKFSLSTA